MVLLGRIRRGVFRMLNLNFGELLFHAVGE
jgi:hypothetical protein